METKLLATNREEVKPNNYMNLTQILDLNESDVQENDELVAFLDTNERDAELEDIEDAIKETGL